MSNHCREKIGSFEFLHKLIKIPLAVLPIFRLKTFQNNSKKWKKSKKPKFPIKIYFFIVFICRRYVQAWSYQWTYFPQRPKILLKRLWIISKQEKKKLHLTWSKISVFRSFPIFELNLILKKNQFLKNIFSWKHISWVSVAQWLVFIFGMHKKLHFSWLFFFQRLIVFSEKVKLGHEFYRLSIKINNYFRWILLENDAQYGNLCKILTLWLPI